MRSIHRKRIIFRIEHITSIRSTLAAAILSTLILLGTAPPLAAVCDHFKRGDTNADGVFDLSDAVSTLLFLFVGAAEPPCSDAADADDTGVLDLSDAIYSLTHLFLGGAPPPAPGALECGPDPTFDDLTCTFEPCVPAPVEQDFSGFTRFEFRMVPALGFCPELDQVFRATIASQEGATYRLELSFLREGQRGVDACLEEVIGADCAVEEPQTPRNLTGGEVERMLNLFRALSVQNRHDYICECFGIDPCRISKFAWDETRVSGFYCEEPHLVEADSARVLDFLETLRGGG